MHEATTVFPKKGRTIWEKEVKQEDVERWKERERERAETLTGSVLFRWP